MGSTLSRSKAAKKPAAAPIPNPTAAQQHLLLKAVMVGSWQCGKTALHRCIHGHPWTPNYTSSVGVDFAVSSHCVDSYHVRLQLWDTQNSNERYAQRIPAGYFRAVGCLFFCFSLTDRRSFDEVMDYVETARKALAGMRSPLVVCLVGCKQDQVEDDTAECVVTRSEIETVLERMQIALGIAESSTPCFTTLSADPTSANAADSSADAAYDSPVMQQVDWKQAFKDQCFTRMHSVQYFETSARTGLNCARMNHAVVTMATRLLVRPDYPHERFIWDTNIAKCELGECRNVT
eukprot:TRINITY_DN1306_c0_g1_i2.p1 TRINITY_DN1306_c0_g1~~TRINITY_DN1306_c0_g1_i2.p1  ORF type:complete len:291 (-),score=47.91 TRINITY_DN1306_c0_g1_i2:55-927(-)